MIEVQGQSNPPRKVYTVLPSPPDVQLSLSSDSDPIESYANPGGKFEQGKHCWRKKWIDEHSELGGCGKMRHLRRG